MVKRIYVDLTDEKDGVTGTCQLFNAFFPGLVSSAYDKSNNIPFMLDCGTFQGTDDEERLNTSFGFDISKPEFAILTHGHLDHYGRFPLAIRKGFYAPIFTSYVTKAFISEVFLDDCLNIEKKHAKKLGMEPSYDEYEVEKMKNIMVPCPYHKEIKYNDNISIYFFDNGHVPGAVVTLLHLTYPGYDEINIVISGDYNDHNTFFKVSPLPQWVYDLPNVTIIIESTYGDTKASELRPACFIKNIVKALEQNKTCVVPTFSFVRTQEVLYSLKEAQDTGKLNPKYPIFIDGKTAIQCTQLFLDGIFKMFEHTKDFMPQNYQIIEDKTFRRYVNHNSDLSISPKIIVSSSGMGSHGPSQYHIESNVNNPNAIIHATGHISPESKLGKLRDDDSIPALFLDTDEYSAHAKQEVLKKFITPFKNVKSIGVTHGDPLTKEFFAKNLLDTFFETSVHVISSDTLFRITSDGIVACFPRTTNVDNQIR